MNGKLLLILVFVTGLGISNVGAQTEIIVETNQSSFQQGQAVIISGNAGQGSVAIQVKEPTGIVILVRSVTTDSDGNFELKFRLSPNAILGDYQAIASVVIDSVPVSVIAAFEVVEEGVSVEKDGVQPVQPKEQGDGGCLIATAAFGSELAPQVQLLREIRDNTVLQTESGASFMTGFNQFYYSFSPAVADYERESPIFKEAVKITLTPLLASLTLLQYADIDSESEMLGYGIGVILLNIGMYFVAPAILIMKINKRI